MSKYYIIYYGEFITGITRVYVGEEKMQEPREEKTRNYSKEKKGKWLAFWLLVTKQVSDILYITLVLDLYTFFSCKLF